MVEAHEIGDAQDKISTMCSGLEARSALERNKQKTEDVEC